MICDKTCLIVADTNSKVDWLHQRHEDVVGNVVLSRGKLPNVRTDICKDVVINEQCLIKSRHWEHFKCNECNEYISIKSYISYVFNVK